MAYYLELVFDQLLSDEYINFKMSMLVLYLLGRQQLINESPMNQLIYELTQLVVLYV